MAELSAENLAIKIPEKHYVGFKRRKEDDGELLGFMIPHGEDKAYEKRKSTVDGWLRHGRHQDLPEPAPDPTIYPNTPQQGFHFGKTVKHGYSWNHGDVKWRVHDPRGFMLELTAGNVAHLMAVGSIVQNQIQGTCVWARMGAENVLLPVDSDVYRQAVANVERAAKSVSLRDVNQGDSIVLQNGRSGIYLGKYFPVERGFERLLSGYTGSYDDYVDCLKLGDKKKHYVLYDAEGDGQPTVDFHPTLKISESKVDEEPIRMTDDQVDYAIRRAGMVFTREKPVGAVLALGRAGEPGKSRARNLMARAESGELGRYTPAQKASWNRDERPEHLVFVKEDLFPQGKLAVVRVPTLPERRGIGSTWSSAISMTTRWVPYDPAAHKLRVLVARITDAKGRVTEFDF